MTQIRLSTLAYSHLLTGMGPGSVGERALSTRICDTLMSQGQNSDGIGNDPAMGRGTTRLFHGFSTILVWRGISR